MNKTITTCILFSLIIPFLTVASEKIYKWIDADGQTHYTTKKPETLRSQEMNIRIPKTQPLIPSKQMEPTEKKTTSERFDDFRKKKENDTKRASKSKKNCQKAQSTAARYKRQVRYSRTTADGKTIYLDDSQREKILIAANKAIKKYCN